MFQHFKSFIYKLTNLGKSFPPIKVVDKSTASCITAMNSLAVILLSKDILLVNIDRTFATRQTW